VRGRWRERERERERERKGEKDKVFKEEIKRKRQEEVSVCDVMGQHI